MSAAVALALALAVATSTTVAVRADDPAVAGAVLLALVDEGHATTGDAAEATHEIEIITAEGGGFIVTCTGKEAKGASVAGGAPALVELELRHRAAALVRQTPARIVDDGAPSAGRARVAVELVDRTGARLGDLLARALVDAGVSLAPPSLAGELLCVDAAADTVAVSWGSTAERCDGRPIALERKDLVPAVAVAEALRLRSAAPLAQKTVRPEIVLAPRAPPPLSPGAHGASPPGPPQSLRSGGHSGVAVDVPPSPAAPAAAVAAAVAPPPPQRFVLARETIALLTIRAGALGREDLAVDPLLDVAAVFPVALGIGPAVVADASASFAPLFIGEGLIAGGAGGAWRLTDDVRVSVGLVAGAWLHAWRYDGSDAGVAFDPAFAVPASVDVRVSDLMSVSVGAQAGALQRRRVHRIRDEAAWARGPIFIEITAGLTFDITRSVRAVENSGLLVRGAGE